MYFNTYRHLFESNEFSELRPEEAFIIATLIETDFVFRLPTLRDALNYQTNGNRVYAYLFAVEGQWGHYVKGKPLFPGTGHMEELEYIFGLTRDWRYPATNNGLNPIDWESDVTNFAENQWSNFGHFGEPTSEWEQIGFKNYSLNYMLISNNADEIFKMTEIDWLMNFWLQEKKK